MSRHQDIKLSRMLHHVQKQGEIEKKVNKLHEIELHGTQYGQV